MFTIGCRIGADVAFLISGSGIIGEQNYQLMLDFTRQLVYGVNVNRKDSQTAVVVFADDAQVRFYLNEFNDFTLPSLTSPSYPDDYVYTQIHALNAVANYYPSVQQLQQGFLRINLQPAQYNGVWGQSPQLGSRRQSLSVRLYTEKDINCFLELYKSVYNCRTAH